MNILFNLFERRKEIRVNVAVVFFGVMSFLFLSDYFDNINSSFAQMDDEQFNLANNSIGDGANKSTSSLNSNDMLAGQQQLSGFTATGKVNTVIEVPPGKWLATGDWHITVDNGNVTSFDTNMTWYNSSGTNAHTHEITNFRPSSESQPLSLKKIDKDIIIEGVTDVGANNRISWIEVPTTFSMKDERILNITIDDTKTNRHFGGQPILGIVDSYRECSDSPGANMEILPPCSDTTVEQEDLGLSNLTDGEFSGFGNETGEFSGFGNETGEFSGFGNETGEFSGFGNETGEFSGFGDQTGGTTGGSEEFSGSRDQTGGTTGGSEEFSGFGDQTGGTTGGSEEDTISREFSGSDDQAGGTQDFSGLGDLAGDQTGGEEDFSGLGDLAGDQTGGEEDFSGLGDLTGSTVIEKRDFGSEFNSNCTELAVENITAGGFESDPADSHPPIDAIDNNSSTWWSDDGKNPWVEINTGQPNTLCGLTVEWNKGDSRDYSFKVEVSENGNDYKEVLTDKNDKGSSEEEIYKIEEIDGQFMRLTVTDTSSNDGWASIKEITAIGIPPLGGEIFSAFGNESGSELGGEQLFPAFGNESGSELGGEQLFPSLGN